MARGAVAEPEAEAPEWVAPEPVSETVRKETESLDDMIDRIVAEKLQSRIAEIMVTGNDARLYTEPSMRDADVRMEQRVAGMPKVQCLINPDPETRPGANGRYPDHTFSINGVNYIYPVGVPVEMPEEMYLLGVRAGRIFPHRLQDHAEVRPIDPEIIQAQRFSEIARVMG